MLMAENLQAQSSYIQRMYSYQFSSALAGGTPSLQRSDWYAQAYHSLQSHRQHKIMLQRLPISLLRQCQGGIMDEEIREFFARAAYYNIKQYQIAKRAGIQPGTISGWNKRNKNPHFNSFKKARVALEELIKESA
jgi:hypothetical protein